MKRRPTDSSPGRLLTHAATDTTVLLCLDVAGIPLDGASLLSFVAAFGLARLAFRPTGAEAPGAAGETWAALAALLLRGGVLALLWDRLEWAPWAAAAVAAMVGAGVLEALRGPIAGASIANGRLEGAGESRIAVARGLAGYLVLLKLVYLAGPEMLHEEGYYWNYSQHLALSYLDHPPAVGWVIALTTAVLGDTVFAIRIGAFALWCVMTLYIFRLTELTFGRVAAWDAVLLCCAIPYFFVNGFVMLPDGPLLAAWAAALYYLRRLLVDEARGAWIGVGLAFGLGAISKYSIALLALAALAFVLIDPKARPALRRPGPWLALALATLVFTPVIVWNVQNDWASFGFQLSRRATQSFDFDLFEFLVFVLLLLGPWTAGTAAVIFAGRGRFPQPADATTGADDPTRRTWRMLVILAVIPVTVFLAASLFRNTKLLWTGPAWAALIPCFAYCMSERSGGALGRLNQRRGGRRGWLRSARAAVIVYGLCLHFLTLGLFGLPYPRGRMDMVAEGWAEVAAQIDVLSDTIEAHTGERPVAVGMDKDQIASWLAFYRGRAGGEPGRGVRETTSGHLFGWDGRMYEFWRPARQLAGKTLILVAVRPHELTSKRVNRRIERGYPVETIEASRHGRTILTVYYRVVEGYRGE